MRHGRTCCTEGLPVAIRAGRVRESCDAALQNMPESHDIRWLALDNDFVQSRPVQSESLRLVSSESVPSESVPSGSDEIGLGVCGVRGGRGPGGVDRVRTVRVCGCGSGGGVHGSIDDNAPVGDDAPIVDGAPIVANARPRGQTITMPSSDAI